MSCKPIAWCLATVLLVSHPVCAATPKIAGTPLPASVAVQTPKAAALPTPTPAQRVAILRNTAATFRRTASELMAAGGKGDEGQVAYAHWLSASATRMDTLAGVGERAIASRRPDPVMSFNLQYLQLQSRMQHENRSYTAISNIMKTKHDTVKNSISNIR